MSAATCSPISSPPRHRAATRSPPRSTPISATADFFAEVCLLGGQSPSFTYSVPEGMHLLPGSLVRVPFGKRMAPALVWELHSRPPAFETKEIDSLLIGTPLVPGHLLDLARWIARYYLCPPGAVVSQILPGRADALLAAVAPDSLPPGRRRTLALNRRLREASMPPAPPPAEDVSARFRPESERHAPPPPSPRSRDADQPTPAEGFDAVDLLLLDDLEMSGIVPDAGVAAVLPPGERLRLNQRQQEAADALIAAIAARSHESFLLHGVTGSGKTAVYLEAAREAIARGLQVLYLVPEIGLTPQTLRRIEGIAGARAALLHSGLTDAERLRNWRQLREGRCEIAVGPRSAIFAPLSRPGLIIVDEEHDSSFKQSDLAPRYHGRDAAVWLAHRVSCPIVLGSATPSLESWHNAATGKYRRLDLPERATGQPMPRIEIVDQKEQRHLVGDRALSMPLRELMVSELAAGRQAILLHNRRGYAPALQCLSCGRIPECPDCPGLRMVLHRAERRLVCHHCGWTETVPTVCPGCGSDALDADGTAIQRVEEELRRLFPDVAVTRLDRDVANARRGEVERRLAAFRKEGGILIGTQMVAKGHDFPQVTLVGVIDAEIGASLPDYRSAERSYQLLSQVAGRAGRDRIPGRVVLQTRDPSRPFLEHLLSHDFPGFATKELDERRALELPPFSRIVLVEAADADPAKASTVLSRLAQRIARLLEPIGGRCLGPVPAPIAVVRRRHRFQLLCKAPPAQAAALRRAVESARDEVFVPNTVRLSIDVDPVDMV